MYKAGPPLFNKVHVGDTANYILSNLKNLTVTRTHNWVELRLVQWVTSPIGSENIYLIDRGKPRATSSDKGRGKNGNNYFEKKLGCNNLSDIPNVQCFFLSNVQFSFKDMLRNVQFL